MLRDEEFIIRAGHGLYLRPDVLSLEAAVRAVRDRLGHRVKRFITISGVIVAMGETSDRGRHALETNTS